jgi:hypothetical protein
VPAVPAIAATQERAAHGVVQSSLVSKGKGKQTVTGGGLLYGIVAEGGSLQVADLSTNGDRKCKTTSATRHGTGTGGVFYYASRGRLSFSCSGTRYRIVLRGKSELYGVGVYGKARFVGVGEYALSDGPPLLWDPVDGTTIDLGTPAPPASPQNARKRGH